MTEENEEQISEVDGLKLLAYCVSATPLVEKDRLVAKATLRHFGRRLGILEEPGKKPNREQRRKKTKKKTNKKVNKK